MVGVRLPLCVVCNEEVNFHQHALCCDNCSRWQHRLCDSGITHKDYRCLTLGEFEIVWHCAICPAANSRQSPQILTKDSNSKLKLGDKDALTNLPEGWKKRTERKSMGPNGKQNIYHISPNRRKFRSKKQALEFCELHYQGVSPVTSVKDNDIFATLNSLQFKSDTPSPITTDWEKNKTYSKITSTEGIDKNLHSLIRLHKLNNNSDIIRNFQPYVHLQRLSPFTILRETNQTKPFVKISRISNVSSRKLVVNDDVMQRKKVNINCKNSFVNQENNNKISKIKKKQKLNTHEVKSHPKSGIKDLKIDKNKRPMKVKAQLKKNYMNINLKIDRKSLQMHPDHNFWLNDDQTHNQNSPTKRWNLKLGTVKVKNKGKGVRNSILKNTVSCNACSEYEKSVGKKCNQSHMLMSSEENTKLRTSNVGPLIWMHISPEDIEFGLIS